MPHRAMEANGIKVAERVPLKVGKTAHNAGYLATKAAKSDDDAAAKEEAE